MTEQEALMTADKWVDLPAGKHYFHSSLLGRFESYSHGRLIGCFSFAAANVLIATGRYKFRSVGFHGYVLEQE